jgi:hypothetical protein
MQGHHDVMKKYIARLLSMLFSFDNNNKLSLLDYIIYLLRPVKKMIFAYFFCCMVLVYFTNYYGLYFIPTVPTNPILTFVVLITALSLEYVSAILEGFRWWKIPSVVYYYTLFTLNDYLATFAGIFVASPKGVWVKTEHKITVSVETAMSN